MTTRRAVLVGLGGLAMTAAAPPDDAARLFDRVWGDIDRRYWDRARLGDAWNAAYDRYRPEALAAPDATAVYRILSTMLATVGDSHVYVRPPWSVARDAATATDNAQFGLSTAPADGVWRVLSVRADGPAAAAGVRPGWLMTAIAGHALDDDWHPAPAQHARFTFRDSNDVPRTLDLTSRVLPPDPPRRVTRLSGDVLLLGFDVFAGGEDRWIRDSIAATAPAALILDLRENEGGEALAVARVAGLFFTEKRTLLKRIARGRTLAVPVAGAGRHAFTGPLALLVGPRSASGAEILAALVQDSGRGIVVGQPTAGAVTGAARIPLPDGGELWVAVFDIRSAADRRLEGVGVVPAYPIRQSLAHLRAGIDPVLDRAIDLIAPALSTMPGTRVAAPDVECP